MVGGSSSSCRTPRLLAPVAAAVAADRVVDVQAAAEAGARAAVGGARAGTRIGRPSRSNGELGGGLRPPSDASSGKGAARAKPALEAERENRPADASAGLLFFATALAQVEDSVV